MAETTQVAFPLVSTDLVQEFQSQRNILVCEEISDELALRIMLVLRHLDNESNDPIYFYINSPGGSVSAGLTIIDNMRLCKSPIYTVCYGCAASMAALIFSVGEKGHRYSLPHGEVMIHQPWRQIQAAFNQSDFEREGNRFKRLRDTLETILSEASGRSQQEMHDACEHDNFLTAEQAIEMGLADIILNKK